MNRFINRYGLFLTYVAVPVLVAPNLPQLLYIGFKLIPQIPYKIGV